MTRLLYQTDADLAAEAEVAAQLVAHFGGVLQKLPIAYKLEYAYYEREGSNLTAWCEVKDRSGGDYTSAQMEKMGGYMLSFSKWLTAYQYASLSDCPFVLAVRLADGLFVVSFTAGPTCFLVPGEDKMEKAPVRYRWGGRSDRGDWQDEEVCAFVPMKLFEKVGTK